MTDQIQQARRAAFENEYVQYRQYLKRNKDGSYNEEWVDARWQGFNAALDSLCIELPDCTEFDSPSGAAPAIEGCRAAIEQTNMGIKIK